MVENPLAGLQNFFFAGDKADPRVYQQLREKIALADDAAPDQEGLSRRRWARACTAIGDAASASAG